MSNTPMRDAMEAAEQSAMARRVALRDQLKIEWPAGTRVTHEYTGQLQKGTVLQTYLTHGRARVQVAWDGGKTTRHDLKLIRRVVLDVHGALDAPNPGPGKNPMPA